MNKTFGFYCLRYVVISVLIALALTILVLAAYAIVPDIANRYLRGNSGMSVVTVLVPALIVGHVFYRQEQRKMTRREGWSMALAFTIIAFVLSGVFLSLIFLLGGADADIIRGLKKLPTMYTGILSIVSAIFFVLYLLLTRLMLWSGVRGAINSEKKLAAKAARKG